MSFKSKQNEFKFRSNVKIEILRTFVSFEFIKNRLQWKDTYYQGIHHSHHILQIVDLQTRHYPGLAYFLLQHTQWRKANTIRR